MTLLCIGLPRFCCLVAISDLSDTSLHIHTRTVQVQFSILICTVAHYSR